jgi:hypothetical protein
VGLGGVDIHANNEEAFRVSCDHEKLEVARWLVSLDADVDIHVFDEVFRFACLDGKLEVAQWLVGLTNDVDIHADEDWAFCNACEQKKLETARWLWSVGGGDGYPWPETSLRQLRSWSFVRTVWILQ